MSHRFKLVEVLDLALSEGLTLYVGPRAKSSVMILSGAAVKGEGVEVAFECGSDHEGGSLAPSVGALKVVYGNFLPTATLNFPPSHSQSLSSFNTAVVISRYYTLQTSETCFPMHPIHGTL